MSDSALTDSLMKTAAARLVEAMPAAEREAIIVAAVEKQLRELKLGYELTRLLTEEAMVLAARYVETPEVQARLQAMMEATVADLLTGLRASFGRALENAIKSKYERHLSPKVYGE